MSSLAFVLIRSHSYTLKLIARSHRIHWHASLHPDSCGHYPRALPIARRSVLMETQATRAHPPSRSRSSTRRLPRYRPSSRPQRAVLGTLRLRAARLAFRTRSNGAEIVRSAPLSVCPCLFAGTQANRTFDRLLDRHSSSKEPGWEWHPIRILFVTSVGILILLLTSFGVCIYLRGQRKKRAAYAQV